LEGHLPNRVLSIQEIAELAFVCGQVAGKAENLLRSANFQKK